MTQDQASAIATEHAKVWIDRVTSRNSPIPADCQLYDALLQEVAEQADNIPVDTRSMLFTILGALLARTMIGMAIGEIDIAPYEGILH